MFIVFTCRYYEGSDPPVNPPPNTYIFPYDVACCYWQSFMINYYNWQPIIIYSGSSGNWVNLQELEHEFGG